MASRAEAAAELLARRKARASMLDFVCYLNPDYIVSDFSRSVCAALDQFIADMEAERRPVLILSAPPQHGKSELVSRYLPAFYLGRNPDQRVAGLSYGKDLATDMNRDVQRIMIGESYANVFPSVKLNTGRATGSDAKRNSDVFEIVDRAGSYIGQGVGGPLTGKRVDCLVAGTMVATDIGDICIEDLPIHANTCKILTYNGKGLSYGRIKAFASSQGFGIYRVTTKSGRVFESTGDHKVFTGRGWVGASELASGDVLVCGVRDRCCSDGGGLSEDGREGRELRELLLAQVRGVGEPKGQTDSVRNLRDKVRRRWQKVLLQSVHSLRGTNTSANQQDVRDVHDAIPGQVVGWEVPILLRAGLRKQGACKANDGGWKSSLSRWPEPATPAAALSKGVPNNKAESVGARWLRLRAVRQEGLQAGSPPLGRMVEQQRIIEFGDSVRCLPQSCPQADGFREVRDHVAAVELVRESAAVYDVQVEGDHNLFANGVLVHNCGIIDDPTKNAQEALSDTVKSGLWNWYTSTFLTRLSKNSGQIIMATRWALDDLSGRVLASNPKALSLVYPAIDANGNALVTELHPLEKLLEIKATMSDYFWSAMYMQSPIILGGGIFKAAWWRFYSALPAIKYRSIYADTAQKTSTQNDYSVFQCWGMGADGKAYLLDQIRGKWESPELLTMARAFWAKHRAAIGIGTLRQMKVEDKSSGTGLIQQLKKEGIPVAGIPRNTDKVSRGLDVAPMIEAGNVLLPLDAPWLSDYLSEFSAFPNGPHDDQCDPTMDAITDMLISQVGIPGGFKVGFLS